MWVIRMEILLFIPAVVFIWIERRGYMWHDFRTLYSLFQQGKGKTD